MYCTNCGMQLLDTDNVCPACGKRVEGKNNQTVKPKSENDGMALAALIFSIIGLFSPEFVFTVLGLVFSIIVLKKEPENSKAKTAKVISVVSIALTIALWLVVIIAYIMGFGLLFGGLSGLSELALFLL